jgi:acyl-coenzyme A thioesterase PaaI-like protein
MAPATAATSSCWPTAPSPSPATRTISIRWAQAARIDYLAPGREGDLLTGEAVEQALSGKTGVYDIKVSNQEGRKIALFRGKSHRVSGMVAKSASTQ